MTASVPRGSTERTGALPPRLPQRHADRHRRFSRQHSSASFFAGALLIETIFSLDGLGLLGFESVINRDYPVVFATLYIFSLMGLLINLDHRPHLYRGSIRRIDFETPRGLSRWTTGPLKKDELEYDAIRRRDRRRPRRRISGRCPPSINGAGSNFKANTSAAYWSLWIFLVLFGLSLFAEFLSNDRPMLVSYKGELLASRTFINYPEEKFGGFLAKTDYRDPFIQEEIDRQRLDAVAGRSAIPTSTVNNELPTPAPSKPWPGLH